MDALTVDQLAFETDTSAEYLGRLVAIGAIHPGAAGAYTVRDIQRVGLIRAFDTSGFGLDRIEKAIQAGIISFDFVDRLFLPPAPRSKQTFAEFQASLGERGPMLGPLMALLGFVQPGPQHRLGTDDEEMLSRFLASWGEDPDTAWRAARLIADAMNRVTSGWTRLYWDRYITPLLESGSSPADARAATGEIGGRVATLGAEMAVWLQQRYLEAAIEAQNVEFMENEMAERGLTPPRDQIEPAVVFADVTGYTSLTDELGDEQAALLAEALRSAAEEATRVADGELVKLLGDGVMLTFPTAEAAITGARALLDSWNDELPPLHVGISVGPLIERDGDYFGSTVNLAARLSQAAKPGQVLVARLRGDPPTATGLERLGSLQLKGIASPIHASQLVAR